MRSPPDGLLRFRGQSIRAAIRFAPPRNQTEKLGQERQPQDGDEGNENSGKRQAKH